MGLLRRSWKWAAALAIVVPPLFASATVDKTLLLNPHHTIISSYKDIDLLTWVTHDHRHAPRLGSSCLNCFLVVGIKTRAIRGFSARQLLRATWASPDIIQPLHTRVVFLACEPDLGQDDYPALQALEQEKEMFGDLLTHELGGCVDSYYTLVGKTLGFLHWVSKHHPSTSYVMVADDDVYVRLDRVVEMLHDNTTPSTRYYAGQVPYKQLGKLTETLRDRWHKNHVLADHYPLSQHVPRAIGAHFLLSMDLVHFLSRNRRWIRGAGAIEDLSIGLWLRSLLHVDPIHVSGFDLLLCQICYNSLVSFGELSSHAIRQIHNNLLNGAAFCRDFSWTAWITPSGIESAYPTLPRRTDVEYEWQFRVNPTTRTVRIDISVHLPTIPLTLTGLSYTPSLSRFHSLCTRLDQEGVQFGHRLPLMLCYDLLDRLYDYVRDHPPLGTALLALTRSNLHPIDSGKYVSVSIWLSHRVLRWRAFIESLMAEVYPDLHIFVIDQVSEGDLITPFVPDFVVVDDQELTTLPDVRQSCRLLVFASTPTPIEMPSEQHDTIVFTRDRPTHNTIFQLYVPLVSLVFSDSLDHSPLALLQSSSTRRPVFVPDIAFAVPLCNPRVADFLSYFPPHKECSGDTNGPKDTIFALDADVTTYSRAKFVLAFQEDQAHPGYIARTIAAAFLAGSIPIYDGDETTISWLFTPNSFVNCGRFASLKLCIAYVMELNRSPALYAQMRAEIPIVNDTAFYEVFSWHPDVHKARQLSLSMATRLEFLINNVHVQSQM